ncbi:MULTISPECIES: YitT family protein [unclassified Sulfurospirillum]|uniref:YitT family protein n=1 Tax=unclassified Sulfurospirillum TaxID=2618290 RepID=UPI00068BD968|nr:MULTISPECIES: YitT family protein [unclassified Sulfurospirillum]
MKLPSRSLAFLQYLYVFLGTMSMAFAVVCFLSPNNMVTGGGIGIALIVHYLVTSLTLGTLIMLVSVPFILLGFIYFGKQYTFKTLLAMFSTSFFTDLFREFLHLNPLTDDVLLAAVFGGIFIGLGVGLVIKGRSSTGSTSVVGEIVAMKSKFKASEVLLSIDVTIMFAYIFVYSDLKKALYSMIGVYVTAKVIDVILTGRPSKKVVKIISNNVEALTEQIRERIEEHGTIFTGIGLHHQKQTKTMILLTVEMSKIQLLKDIIREYDPEAFLIISEASEFLGRD